MSKEEKLQELVKKFVNDLKALTEDMDKMKPEDRTDIQLVLVSKIGKMNADCLVGNPIDLMTTLTMSMLADSNMKSIINGTADAYKGFFHNLEDKPMSIVKDEETSN